MKAKDDKEKEIIKRNFSVLVWKLIKNSKHNSARDFALDIGVEPAHIQKIIRDNKDVALTTIVTIAEGLGFSMRELGKSYDEITKEDIEDYKKEIAKQRRLRGKKNTTKK